VSISTYLHIRGSLGILFAICCQRAKGKLSNTDHVIEIWTISPLNLPVIWSIHKYPHTACLYYMQQRPPPSMIGVRSCVSYADKLITSWSSSATAPETMRQWDITYKFPHWCISSLYAGRRSGEECPRFQTSILSCIPIPVKSGRKPPNRPERR